MAGPAEGGPDMATRFIRTDRGAGLFLLALVLVTAKTRTSDQVNNVLFVSQGDSTEVCIFGAETALFTKCFGETKKPFLCLHIRKSGLQGYNNHIKRRQL